MWIDPKTKMVASNHSELRQLRPNWSVGQVITEQQIAEMGFMPVQQQQPIFDPATEKLVAGDVVRTAQGWIQPHTVVALSAEELQLRIPKKVTRRQARQALRLAGLLHLVQPAIDAIPDPVQRDLAQIEWDDSLEFERDRPLVMQIARALGLTDAQLDQLFITAATL